MSILALAQNAAKPRLCGYKAARREEISNQRIQIARWEEEAHCRLCDVARKSYLVKNMVQLSVVHLEN